MQHINAANLVKQPVHILEIELHNFKISKTTRFSSDCLPPACLPASWLALRPGCARCMAPEFLHDKGNHVRFTKLLFQ